MSTSQAKTTSLWVRAIAYGLLTLARTALAGLPLTSYSSLQALILGLLTAAGLLS